MARYHAHLAEIATLRTGEYNLLRFSDVSDSSSLAISILARIRLAKMRTMARPNSPLGSNFTSAELNANLGRAK